MSVNTTTTTDAAALAARFLQSSAHGWSVGIPGAIGEFMYDADEPITFGGCGNTLSAVTARGAISITLPADAAAVAYEEIAECTGGWNQGVAFCVPADAARVPAVNVLTEVGPDHGALTDSGRREILFDLGLGSDEIRFCVRTADAELLEVLRTGAGRSIFEPDNPVFNALRERSPARVVLSAVGRVEVLQSIAEQGGAAPRGPHTHLLPGLLKRKMDATPPLRPGTIAPLRLYPEHPLYDKYGTPTPFNCAAYEAFQALLASHGAPGYLTEKAEWQRSLAEGAGDARVPGRAQPGWTPYAVALSQMQVLGGR